LKTVFKVIFCIVFLASIGHIWAAFDDGLRDVKEPKMYGVISLYYPSTNAKLTMIKISPASQCEKWREDYYSVAKPECGDCETEINHCTSELPKEYLGVFEKKRIQHSYIYKPYGYPEVMITENTPEGAFGKLCEFTKNDMDEAVCID